MSFRFKHRDLYGNILGIARSELSNNPLYSAFLTVATRVMCDVYELTVDDCTEIPEEALDYRDNLLDHLVSTVIIHEKEKK